MKTTLSIGKSLACLALLCAFVITSCKKELLTPPVKQKLEGPIKKITYSEFLKSVDLGSLGVLKQKFHPINRTEKIMSIGDQNYLQDLAVYTDTIQKIIGDKGTSYVFKMPLTSPHSLTFRNLTIEVRANRTSAFIATYIPTRKWINDRKKSPYIVYNGDVSFAPINLESVNLKEAFAVGNVAPGSKLMSSGNKTMLTQIVCNYYTVVTYTPYGCSNGNHMPWDENCAWNTGDLEVPEWERAAGYDAHTISFEACDAIEVGGSSGGDGGGGGGGSTPTPPSDYDPCNGNVPTASKVYEKGTRLMTAMGNECDGEITPPVIEPVLTLEQSTLLANPLVAKDFAIKDYILNNPSRSFEIHEMLEEDDFSYESQIAAAMLIKATINNQLESPNSQTNFAAVSSVLPATINPDLGMYFATYFSTECAIIKFEHPDWPKWKVFYHASKEMLHLALDGIGLIPVYGEVADLANAVIYLVEGDGVNASLSVIGVIPVAGWWATGARYAKKTINLANGSKTTLKWVAYAGNAVHFGNRSQLRKILNLAKGDLRQAHHIIPWAKSAHRAIQKAAKSKYFFHMNEALNGIPLNTLVHSGSHSHYDDLVQLRLDQISSNLSPEQTYDEILNIISDIRNAINNYPNVPLNQLLF
ncbi:hypothetical protein D3C86_204360 [compost metagenome]